MPKANTLHSCIYVVFLKRQNIAIKKQISVQQKFRVGENVTLTDSTKKFFRVMEWVFKQMVMIVMKMNPCIIIHGTVYIMKVNFIVYLYKNK